MKPRNCLLKIQQLKAFVIINIIARGFFEGYQKIIVTKRLRGLEKPAKNFF